jgi:hypothetical protein
MTNISINITSNKTKFYWIKVWIEPFQRFTGVGRARNSFWQKFRSSLFKGLWGVGATPQGLKTVGFARTCHPLKSVDENFNQIL